MKPKFKECMDLESVDVLQLPLSLPDQLSPIALRQGRAGIVVGAGVLRWAGQGSLEHRQGESASMQGRE